MAKPTKVRFQPDPEQSALMPVRSGNDINGLGEAEFRRPTRIYWHNPKDIPHGGIQKWMVERFNRVPEFKNVYAEGDRGPQVLKPVAESRVQHSPQSWSDKLRDIAGRHEADLVGIAKMNPDWCFADCGLRYRSMDHRDWGCDGSRPPGAGAIIGNQSGLGAGSFGAVQPGRPGCRPPGKLDTRPGLSITATCRSMGRPGDPDPGSHGLWFGRTG